MPNEHLTERMINTRVSKCKQGIIRRDELVPWIAAMALEPGFFECLAGLPADLIEEVRQYALHPFGHPEDVINNKTGFYRPMTEEEFEELQRLGRIGAYWSLRVLYEHFFPGQPFPRFEPIRLIGVVEDATVVDGSVVLFGIQYHYVIRKHPIQCVSQSGERLITSVVEEHLVRCPGDEMHDGFRSHHGRYGLFLDANVRSPSDVPPGTEVWVDRSDAYDIPPLSDCKPRLLH